MDRHALIRLRANLGLSQARLAELLVVSPECVHRYERGARAIPADARGLVLTCLAAAAARDLAATRAACVADGPVPARLFRILALALDA